MAFNFLPRVIGNMRGGGGAASAGRGGPQLRGGIGAPRGETGHNPGWYYSRNVDRWRHPQPQPILNPDINVGARPSHISAGPSGVYSTSPTQSECHGEVFKWYQDIVRNLPNPSGNSDCQKAFGFKSCEKGRHFRDVLGRFADGLIFQAGGKRTDLDVQLADCDIPVTFSAAGSQKAHDHYGHYCSPGTPGFNIHCRILIGISMPGGLGTSWRPVRSFWLSTTCCLCCDGAFLGVTCGHPHQDSASKKKGIDMVDEVWKMIP